MPIILTYVNTGWRFLLNLFRSKKPKLQGCELIKESVEYDEYGLPTMELINGRLVKCTDYSLEFRKFYGEVIGRRLLVGSSKPR